jgi:hypothetical protein
MGEGSYEVFAAPTNCLAEFVDVQVGAVSEYTIKISWTDNTEGAAFYSVKRRDAVGSNFLIDVGIVFPGINFLYDYGIDLSKSYEYEITPFRGSDIGYSGYSNTLPDIPATPKNLVATLTTGKIINLSWDISPYTYSYIVWRSKDGAPYVAWGETTRTIYPDTYVESLSTYSYKIQARNGAGLSLLSIPNADIIVVDLPDYDVPSLWYDANPPTYEVGTPNEQGLLISPAGVGQFNFSLSGVLSNDTLYCVTPTMFGTLTGGITYGLIKSNNFGRNVRGGKTLYSQDFDADCEDDFTVIVERRFNKKGQFEEFIRGMTNEFSASRLICSGEEFRMSILLDGIRKQQVTFRNVKCWFKLTDLRGFNTNPIFGGMGEKGQD